MRISGKFVLRAALNFYRRQQKLAGDGEAFILLRLFSPASLSRTETHSLATITWQCAGLCERARTLQIPTTTPPPLHVVCSHTAPAVGVISSTQLLSTLHCTPPEITMVWR